MCCGIYFDEERKPLGVRGGRFFFFLGEVLARHETGEVFRRGGTYPDSRLGGIPGGIAGLLGGIDLQTPQGDEWAERILDRRLMGGSVEPKEEGKKRSAI